MLTFSNRDRYSSCQRSVYGWNTQFGENSTTPFSDFFPSVFLQHPKKAKNKKTLTMLCVLFIDCSLTLHYVTKPHFPVLAHFRLTFLSLQGDESIMSMLSVPDMIWPLQMACGTYTWPSTQHSMNSMLFSVRVPVLSVKTYSTWESHMHNRLVYTEGFRSLLKKIKINK